MRIKILILITVLIGLAVSFIAWKNKEESVLDNTFVLNELIKNGKKSPLHYIKNPTQEEIQKGEDLILNGWTIHEGKKSKRISKYFVCTDCHNIKNEEENLLKPTPEGRLRHAVQNELPFLQATTLYGVVNRNSWYNDDYVNKYGDWVKPARDTLENATQLCAVVCSQGRRLEKWEMTSILSYYQTIGYKIKDLKLSKKEKKLLLNDSLPGKTKNNILESKYLGYSPATFGDITPIKERGYGENGNPKNGQLIYDKSCKHCHEHENIATSLKLDDSKLTFKLLNKKLNKNSRFSLYNIVRKGTYAEAGLRAYMPHYTLERMSNQQLEDLVSFVKLKSK